jgi:steroid delta-isomerase
MHRKEQAMISDYFRMSGVILVALATTLAISRPAAADDAAEIRARLVQWTEDFNAGHKDAACDLFSKELISDFRGQGEANYATRCALIAKAIDDPNRKFRYQLHIKEIMTGANLAVVRLDWTLEISPPGQKVIEPGMDVFRKETDGMWRIIRYMAYEAP